jgi:N-acyl-D-amino-acid deacylase
VREEKRLGLSEAIRKLTSLPATNLKLDRRGTLRPGYYADIVIFDPNTIRDLATFEKPHQYAQGVQYVWVNGALTLDKGEHTGATKGRFVKGRGAKTKN